MVKPSTPKPVSFKAQLLERRLQHVESTSARSRRGFEADRPAAEIPPGFFRKHRRWCLLGAAAAVLLAAAVPEARRWLNEPSHHDLRAGLALFTHKWQPQDSWSAAGDGLGPVFNAQSCVECHFQGGVGGAGDARQNVAAFEVLPTEGHPQPGGGVIHAFAVQSDFKETKETVRGVFPIIPKGVTITAVCQQPIQADHDPLVHHSINTPTLFGAGAIDRIPTLALRAHRVQSALNSVPKELAMEFDKVVAGRLRVLPDGRIGKFGWKAQFATLEEFVANACAVEVGLTTPTRKQHLPRQHREDPAAQPDLEHQQFRQLVSFVAKLPAPTSVPPSDPVDQARVARGRELFTEIGCAACHVPDWGDVKGVYSDFCLHDLSDPKQDVRGYRVEPVVPVPEDYPHASEWKTPPLWGVAQTAPYLHDGSAATLAAAIQAHDGQSRHVRAAYRKLDEHDQRAVLTFLESLRTVEP